MADLRARGRRGFYQPLAGGAGAVAGHPGAGGTVSIERDAVGMTLSLADAEELEHVLHEANVAVRAEVMRLSLHDDVGGQPIQ